MQPSSRGSRMPFDVEQLQEGLELGVERAVGRGQPGSDPLLGDAGRAASVGEERGEPPARLTHPVSVVPAARPAHALAVGVSTDQRSGLPAGRTRQLCGSQPGVATPAYRSVSQAGVDMPCFAAFNTWSAPAHQTSAAVAHWIAEGGALDHLIGSAPDAGHWCGGPAGRAQPGPGVGASPDGRRSFTAGPAGGDLAPVVTPAAQGAIGGPGVDLLGIAPAHRAGVPRAGVAGLAPRPPLGVPLHHPSDFAARRAGLPP